MEIKLGFEDNLTALAGYDYGKETAKKLIDNVDLKQHFTLEFPKQITDVAQNFMDGFIGTLITNLGKDNYLDNAHFKGNSNVVNKLYNYIDIYTSN